jgi:hypothetical protein
MTDYPHGTRPRDVGQSGDPQRDGKQDAAACSWTPDRSAQSDSASVFRISDCAWNSHIDVGTQRSIRPAAHYMIGGVWVGRGDAVVDARAAGCGEGQ